MLQRQFCTFYLDGMLLGVEVHKVQEVLRHQQMTKVPLAHSVIGGLINLRGQIVTAMDLRRRFGLSDRPAGCFPMNVVVRTEDGVVSLLVDEIGDVVEVGEQAFEPSPDTLTGETRTLVHGVYKLKDRLLLVLNTAEALEMAAAA